MTYGLLAVSVVVIVTGITFGDVANLKPYFSDRPSEWPLLGVFAVFATTPFWYAGFDTIPQAMGEIADRRKIHLVPRVIMLAIGCALIFYCLIILSTSMAMPRYELLALDLPTAGVFAAMFNSSIVGKVVLTAGLCGLISTWNAAFFATTRLIYALGRAHLIPSVFGHLHERFASPHKAVVFVVAICIVMTLLGREAILPIIQTGAACMSLVFLIVSIGVIRLRIKEPDRLRPYRLPGGMWIPVLAALIAGGMLYLAIYEPYRQAPDRGVPTEWIIFAVWLTLGALFWFASQLRQPRMTEADRKQLILV
jgi:amino acid transporter